MNKRNERLSMNEWLFEISPNWCLQECWQHKCRTTCSKCALKVHKNCCHFLKIGWNSGADGGKWSHMVPKSWTFGSCIHLKAKNSMWNQLKLAATSSLKYSRCTEEEHGNETDYRCYELRAETKRFLNASIFKKSDASNANFNKGNDVTSVLRHSMKWNTKNAATVQGCSALCCKCRNQHSCVWLTFSQLTSS